MTKLSSRGQAAGPDPTSGPAARQMAWGFNEPWTNYTLEMCVCGHPRGDHLKHRQLCIYSTETETWACECLEFRPVTADSGPGTDPTPTTSL